VSGLSYRRDIDGLRSLAVLPVVFNHAGFAAFPGGFVGVDIFFVISGFLITGILMREISETRFSIVSFYERRLRRILPALAVVLLTCLVAGWFILLPDQYRALGKSTAATLFFSSNIWFWRGAADYFGSGVQLEPLLHTWSLAVEEQFYVFFPLVLWGLAGWSRRVSIIVVLSLSIASFLLSVWATRAAPISNFYLTPTRVWELGLGALLALGAFPTLRARVLREAVAATGLALIAGSVVLMTDATPFPGLTALPACAGAVALIWAGSHGPSFGGRLLSLPPLVGMGLISYSLYLWHWPILVGARLTEGTSELPLPTATACVLAAFVLAWTSWRFVERPFRGRRGGLALSRAGVFALSGAASASLLCAAFGILLLKGISARLPEDVRLAYRAAVSRDALDVRCMQEGDQDAACSLGAANRPPEIVVWGDSHAGAMLPGIDAWLKSGDKSAVAFTKTACAPLLGVWRVDQGIQHRCDAHNARVLDWITAQEGVTRVILVSRWALLTEGTRQTGEEGAPALLAVSGQAPQGLASNPGLVAQGLEGVVSHLRERGIEVTILDSVPEIGFSVPEAIARLEAFGMSPPSAPSRSAFDHRNARAESILTDVSSRYGSHLVRVADVMCATDCQIAVDGRALYRDDDHLSVFGATWLMPRVLN
jgi:peptidoglycan/LPS O-acetylase OafA/YrhL